MEPTGNGIGGDLLLLLECQDQKFWLKCQWTFTKNLTLDYFLENNYSKIPAYGPLPVSVSGCVDGWFELHERLAV